MAMSRAGVVSRARIRPSRDQEQTLSNRRVNDFLNSGKPGNHPSIVESNLIPPQRRTTEHSSGHEPGGHSDTIQIVEIVDFEAGFHERRPQNWAGVSAVAVSYTHLRAHETRHDLVCRL